MKWTVLLVFCILVSMSLIAWFMIPEYQEKGKTSLKWVTDPNPEREPQVSNFNRLNPDCKLAIDPDNSGVMKVVVQCSAGMGPDLIDGINEETIQTYVDAGILKDVTEEAKKLGFTPNNLPESFRSLIMAKVLTKDGKYVDRQFCYPCNIYSTFLFYNKNIFDKYKVPYPKEDITWDEYIELGQKLTKYSEDDKIIPEIFGAAGTPVEVIAWEMGGNYFNKWGTVCNVDEKPFIDAYEMYHNLLYKYNIEPSPAIKAGVTSQGGWGGGDQTWFAEGKLAILWGARWTLIQLRRFITEQRQKRKEWIKANPDKDVSECPIEVVRIGCTLTPRFKGGKRYSRFGARNTGVNSKGKNVDKAVKFLAYLAGPDYCKIINEGSDSMPGNKKYFSLERFYNKDFPGEEEVHQMSIKAIPYGRTFRRSPFVNNATLIRVMKKVTDKIVSEKNITRAEIAEALKKAADELNTKIVRHINRNEKLRKIYNVLLKEGAAPVRYKDLLTTKNINKENQK